MPTASISSALAPASYVCGSALSDGQDVALLIGLVALLLLLWAAFRFRSRREVSLQCSHCGAAVVGKPRIDLLGQRKLMCAACASVSVLPMSKRYLAVYLFLFVSGLLGTIAKIADTPDAWQALLRGDAFVFTGGLGMLCMIALTRDMLLRLRPAPEPSVAEPHARPPGVPPPLPRSPAPRRRHAIWIMAVLVLVFVVSIVVLVSALRAGWKLS